MKEQFKEYQNRKILDKVCSIHNVNYWQISIPIRGSDERKLQEFCPECVRENIQREEQELANEATNQQVYQKTYHVLMRDSVIPDELKTATFDNFIVETQEEKQLLAFAQNQVKKYLEGMNGNTLVTGSTGVGKSHLSVAMAKAINEGSKAKNDPKSVLFVTFTDIVNKIQDGWTYGKNAAFTKSDAVELLKRPDYLIIDDLGAKNAVIKPKNDWEQDLLFDILNNRENTIINTNLSGDELKTVYNERNYSRILKGLEGNSFRIYSIKDKRYSIRQLKTKQVKK